MYVGNFRLTHARNCSEFSDLNSMFSSRAPSAAQPLDRLNAHHAYQRPGLLVAQNTTPSSISCRSFSLGMYGSVQRSAGMIPCMPAPVVDDGPDQLKVALVTASDHVELNLPAPANPPSSRACSGALFPSWERSLLFSTRHPLSPFGRKMQKTKKLFYDYVLDI
jgi:hypothetical protein